MFFSFLRSALLWTTALLLPASFSAQAAANNDLNLPQLGDASSGIVSPQEEHKLGQAWLRLYRSQVPTSSDPLLYEYLNTLLLELARHSDLRDQALELILVKNPTMNAFAVPGGIIGVHTGLLLFADDEDQLASVLSHELAHLSQRHYARSVEQRQQTNLPTMAAMLASLVLAATAGGDAGLAAITATQAAALDSRLRFSRQNEQEADRVGMQTMVSANKNPAAVPEMFESMLQSVRYTQRPPEFLLTHPVTEKRIADSRNRANQYPIRQYASNPDYFLMQARVKLLHASSPQKAVQHFTSELEGESASPEASRYGLVLALTSAQQTERARQELKPLLEKAPDKIAYQLAKADIVAAENKLDEALELLAVQIQTHPFSHPLKIRYAELLMAAGRYAQCEQLLTKMSRTRSNDDYVWYLLAEVHGLAGNIQGVHTARAEFFILNGVFDKALIQLDNALKLSKGNFHQTALIKERIRYVKTLQEQKFN